MDQRRILEAKLVLQLEAEAGRPEFKVILGCVVSLRSAWAMEGVLSQEGKAGRRGRREEGKERMRIFGAS